MTIVSAYPPIAAAAFVWGLWFIRVWRLSKRDERLGDESLQQALWLLLAPMSLGGFMWWHGFSAPIVTSFDLFMTAMIGLAFGSLAIWIVKLNFFDPVSGLKERALRIVYLAFYVCLIFSGFLIDLSSSPHP